MSRVWSYRKLVIRCKGGETAGPSTSLGMTIFSTKANALYSESSHLSTAQ
jgi:hypothetical protein